MSEVQFNEDNEFHIKSRALFGDPQTPTMIRFLMKTGLAKTEKNAVVILLILVVILGGITWWVLSGRSGGEEAYMITPGGTKYELEEYIDSVKNGFDPLNIEN